jgi:hypothetical protein
MVLAMLVNREGKPAPGGGPVKGQFYATPDRILVVRPTAGWAVAHRAMNVLLLGSVAVVLANLFLWRSMTVIWIAGAAQAVYWLLLPTRRRSLEPRALDEAGLEAARRAGRVAVQLPARDVLRVVPPEPPRTGFRKPARFETEGGALEVYLSPEQYAEIAAVLQRPA